MPPERLLASYILRVSARAGKCRLSLHDLRSGETRVFPSYHALLEHVSRGEVRSRQLHLSGGRHRTRACGPPPQHGRARLVMQIKEAVMKPLAALLTALICAFAFAQTTHEVMLMIEEVEGRPVPEFFFEPVGLLIQPGDTVRFVAATPHHTATAFHAQHVKSHRVPEGVPPFSSPVIPVGEVWEYTFDVPGTYDLWCGPHEPYGMVMRIVVGEPSGPAEEPVTDFSPVGAMAAAGTVLNDPALASDNIVAAGSVSWSDISEESKMGPEQP
jgi:plastocyanin